MRRFLLFVEALVLLSAFSPVVLSSSSSNSREDDMISAPTNTTLQWESCSDTPSFECATLNVPSCYSSFDGGCSIGKTMNQSFVFRRMLNKRQIERPIVWVVHDTILSKQKPEQLMNQLSKLAASNVYMVQSRLFEPYANGSSSTHCRSLAASYLSPSSVNAAMLTAVAKCKALVETQVGTNGIRAFSIDAAVQDLALAMRAVATQGNPPFIYASGRGVRIVSRLLSQTNISVAGVIYDSPPPTPLAEEPVGAAMDRFLAACDTDTFCHDKFKGISTTLADTLKNTHATVDTSAQTLSSCFQLLYNASFDASRDLRPSHGVRRFFMSMYTVSPTGTLAIPPVLYRLQRCNQGDVKFLQRFFDKMRARAVTEDFETNEMALFVDDVVSFSEFWPALQSREQLVSTFEASSISHGLLLARQASYCAFSASSDPSCLALYTEGLQPNQSSTLVYPAPTTMTTGSKTNVLVLASRLSPVGAGTAASQMYETLQAEEIGTRTVIMVQSDGLTTTELAGALSSSLQNVIAHFLLNRARVFNGKWHISDLESFSFDEERPSTASTVSTLETKASDVGFVMDQEDAKTWFVQNDPYEGYKIVAGRGGEADDPSLKTDDASWTTFFVIGGVSLIVFCGLGFFLLVRCGLVVNPQYRLLLAVVRSREPAAPPNQSYQGDYSPPLAEWQVPPNHQQRLRVDGHMEEHQNQWLRQHQPPGQQF